MAKWLEGLGNVLNIEVSFAGSWLLAYDSRLPTPDLFTTPSKS